MLRFLISTFLLAFGLPNANANESREPDGIHGQLKSSAPSIKPNRDCPMLLTEGDIKYCARTTCVAEALAAVGGHTVWMTGEWVLRDGQDLDTFEIDSIYSGDVDPTDPSSKLLFEQSTCAVPAS